ncbi:MAG: hypothetical protein MJ016_06575 [Victivallaceae bacterium]|nr:hypothetical protein [Victivallaceae bacterium]
MLKALTRMTPLAMNFISYGFGFLFAAEIAKSGGTGWQVSLPPLAGSLLYPFSTWVVGRIITPKRIAYLVTASGAGILVCAAGTYFFVTIPMLVVWNLVLLTSMTCYVVPAQLLLKRIQCDGAPPDVARSTAFYLFGVAIGQGAGSLFCGYVDKNAFLALCFALIGVLIPVVLLTDRKHPTEAENLPETQTSSGKNGTASPDKAVVAGWIIAGLLSLSLSMMTASVTFRGMLLGLSQSDCADALGIRSLVEAVVISGCFFFKKWVHRAAAPFWIVCAVMTSEIAFATGTNAFALSAAAGLFGAALGAGLFYVSYHALASSGSNGKYAVVSEIVIGVTQILGPGCGATATEAASFTPFLIAATAAAAVLLFFCFYLPRREAGTPAKLSRASTASSARR